MASASPAISKPIAKTFSSLFIFNVSGGSQIKMRPSNGDTCLNIDHINLENKYKNKRSEASVQTSHIVPYRLRFWPGTNCDVKLSPSETNCGLRAKCCCRIISQWILSQVGLTIIVVIWALLGALFLFHTEAASLTRANREYLDPSGDTRLLRATDE
ncbi:hypothetical protein NQ317_003843 [Molorchus minor]|uniref:Uncharacterized protein n=1 Tax=Molorchus minor TaxID=1323400 RepID=A0ABQ9IQC3_9CUCU|nr:hypothetical protein NQ317_003843 [Molorchus minor]